MPGFVKTKKDEKAWDKAKSLAEEAGHKEDWPYVTGIWKKITGKTANDSVIRVALRYLEASNVTISYVLGLLKKELWRPEYRDQAYEYRRVQVTPSVNLQHRRRTYPKKEEFVVSWYTGNPGRYWGTETFSDLKSAVAKINLMKDESDRIYAGDPS